MLSWLIMLALSGTPAAQADPNWFGTWTLNLARSTYSPGPPPFRRATRKIEPAGDGIKITDDQVRQRGGITHLEWTGTLDGRDYAVQGVELVLTNAYRRLDDRTYELIQKIDGEVVSKGRFLIAPDGGTLTMVIASGTASTTAVYDRQ